MDARLSGIVSRARTAIAELRAADIHFAAEPSQMWRENVDAFRYLLEDDDLAPFEQLRKHTHHITGDPGRKLHAVSSTPSSLLDPFLPLRRRFLGLDARTERARRYERWLRATRPERKLLDVVVEPPQLGGAEIPSSVLDGRPYNFETSRFLVVLQNIKEWGAVPFDRAGLRVLDLGGGWGGLAYFMRQLFADSHVTVIDLPETLIFSIPYLMQCDPARTFYMPGRGDGLGDPAAMGSVDYSFYSPGIFERTPPRTFDLIVNTGSMAEMTADQVRYYIAQIKRVGKGAFYSFNEDRQGRNNQLESLTAMLEREFETVRGRHVIAPFQPIGCTWSTS